MGIRAEKSLCLNLQNTETKQNHFQGGVELGCQRSGFGASQVGRFKLFSQACPPKPHMFTPATVTKQHSSSPSFDCTAYV